MRRIGAGLAALVAGWVFVVVPAAAAETPKIAWLTSSEAGFKAAADSGKPVLIDFTADG